MKALKKQINWPAAVIIAALALFAGYQTSANRQSSPPQPAVLATIDIEEVFYSLDERSAAFMADAYARVSRGEVFLHNCHISPYEKGTYANHEPERVRKLLLNRREINKLIGSVEEKGLTLTALKIYFKNGRAKVEIGLARGKKLHDKRDDLAKRDARREVDRAIKESRR